MADHLEAVAAEVAIADGSSDVRLGKHTVTVPAVRKWHGSAIRALRDGNFDLWAEKTLSPRDYLHWTDIDPTIEQAETFFEAWSSGSGQSVGESSASPRSANRTARRSKQT